MEEIKRLYVSSEEAPTKEVGDNEFRQYYLFREKDTNYPLEVIITEMPPGYVQPFHRHEILQESTIVLEGEAMGIIKDGDKEKEYPIKVMSFYEEYAESNNFEGIVVADDGTLLFVLEDKETKEVSGGELPYDEAFNAGDKFHTIKNNIDKKTITATIKFTDIDTLKENPKIFQEDKISEQ